MRRSVSFATQHGAFVYRIAAPDPATPAQMREVTLRYVDDMVRQLTA
jgi:hypothetical protein